MTLKFKAGKEYRTGGGKKAYCVYVIPPKLSNPYPVIMRIDGRFENFTLDGKVYEPLSLKYFASGGKPFANNENPKDIVSEWQDEPETVDISEWYHPCWILENKSWFVGRTSHKSKSEALEDAQRGLFPMAGKYGVLKVGTTIITDIHEV